MTPEAFLETFDQLAEVPGAVARLREVILELAVTGKLVTQSNRDEPAAMLLRSAEAERARLVSADRIRSRQAPPIGPDEQPYEVPNSWAWARLSDVGYGLGQKVPDKRFTYIDVGGIDSGKGHISDRVEKLEPGEAPSRARKLVVRGAVIYATVRPYLLNIAVVDQDYDPEPIVSTAFCVLHPLAGISNRYLFHWLRSRPFTAYVQAAMKGMAYPAISDEKFYSGPVPLPPLAEQERIVARVDELMALCDRLEALQQEREQKHAALARAALARFNESPTPANLEFLFHTSYDIAPADLRKAILTLAVQGKLVPQNPSDEPASACLARLGLRSTSQRQEPGVVPSSWACVLFDDVAAVSGGLTLGRKLHGRRTVSLPYLRVANVKRGVLDLGEVKEVLVPEDEVERYTLRKNDLLMAEGGDWDKVGRAAVWTGKISPCLHQNHVFRARMRSEELDPVWFERYFNSPVGRSYFESASKQTTNLASINMRQVRGCPVPVPPLAEQRRIVAKVDHLMALVDRLEAQLAAARTAGETLMAAVIASLTGSG
ncbi:MAG: restriction endonuclease subunit S [Lentisphaerae bacterium]|nr:restriction endonuclease subunit S [Lentisphaerota bacterium]